MSSETPNNDPLQFMKSMWSQMGASVPGFSLPGMVTPTLDNDELEKRITDLKAVEGWLRMNLSMLQLTIQGLEMQQSTLSAVRTMNTQAGPAADVAAQAFSHAALWPWEMMSKMQQKMEQEASAETAEGDAATAPQTETGSAEKAAPKRSKKSQ
jgi:hypothetical protein